MTGAIHATCVAIGGRGVLLSGASGSGKSDLALRLIDRGAILVSDDYTPLSVRDGVLIAHAPERMAGRIEVRGLGIVPVAHMPEAAVALLVALDEPGERMPEPETRILHDVAIPLVRLDARAASAALKVEIALGMA